MPSPRAARPSGGFSLIELLMALSIVALVGGMVFVDYSGATMRERLKAAARLLAGYGEMVRSVAISKAIMCRLEIDFDKSRFRYVIDPPRDEYGRFVDPDDPDRKRLMTGDEIDEWDASFEWDDLPRDVYVKKLVISSREFYDKSIVSWPFWPDGSVAPYVLHLSTSQGQVASVSMNGLTGSAEAIPDVLLGFPEADSSDFSSIMGNRPPGAGQQKDERAAGGRGADDAGGGGGGRNNR
jgi:prepilin-type N-terminal cleavage/methylation domain-containing protein